MKDKRIEWIDWLKGICIIFIVIGHVIRGFLSAGMYNKDLLNYIDYTIYSFHMPLMFFLSGTLYGKSRDKNLENWKEFIFNKIIKLYIPYVIFSCIMFVFKLIFSSNINSSVSIKDFFVIFIKPFDIYWFLIALLIIFIIYSFMDYKKLNKKYIIGFGILSLIISFYIEKYYPNEYYFKTIFYYAGLGFYFYLGNILTDKIIPKKMLIPSIFLYVILNIINYKFNLQSITIEIILALSMMTFLLIYAR